MTDLESNHALQPPTSVEVTQPRYSDETESPQIVSSNQRWRWWLLVLSIGLLSTGSRYYYLTHAQVLQPFYDQQHARADGVEYYAYARNLVRHGVFSKSPEGHAPLVGDSYRDPGYPLFLAGWMEIFPQWDSWYPAVLLSQGLLSALSVVLALYIGRRWMPVRWLAVAGVLMALWPHNISMSSFILSESLFGFLCMLAMFLFAHAINRLSVGWMTASGVAFAFSALTNAVLMPFAPVLGAYFLCRRYINFPLFAGLMVGALALPIAWTVRNISLPPSYGDSSAGRALDNLVIGSWPNYYKIYNAALAGNVSASISISHVAQEIALINYSLSDGLAEIFKRVKNSPSEHLKWYLYKPELLWGWNIRIGEGDIYVYPTRNSPFERNVGYRAIAAICHTLNPLIFLLMIAGCVISLRPKREASHSLPAPSLLLVFITVIYSMLQSEPRYSIAFRPLELMLATLTIYRACFWLNRKRHQKTQDADISAMGQLAKP